MDADWEFEVGGDAPVIEAAWAGFVDLKREPERAKELTETAALPGLAETLTRLNGVESPVWTSKCDFWPRLEAGEFDADELDAPREQAECGVGCYIDMNFEGGGAGEMTPEELSVCCRAICRRVNAAPLRCCRVDLVIRRAYRAGQPEALGVTAYLTACGESPEKASETLTAALAILADAAGGQSTVE